MSVNLVNEFVRRNFAVDVVLFQKSGPLLDLLDPRVRLVDLEARRFRNGFLPLVRYLRASQPVAMLACMWPLTVLAIVARAASGSKTRVVVAEHTTWSVAEHSRNWLQRLRIKATMRLLIPRAAAVVTVSQGAAEDLAEIARMPRDRVKTIYNPIVGGVRTTVVEAMPETLEWTTGPHHKILAVGTLKAIKDYASLLQAFAILRKGVDAKLLILGEGEERESLEALIAGLGIGDAVSLPGCAASTESYYRKADLHVLSSVGEGLPTVIVEALEQGVPVVSTDCRSGPREILHNGKYGTLVPVGDVASLASAMGEALSLEHDHEALKRRAQDFSVDKAADAYLDVLLPDWRQASAQGEGEAWS